MPSSLRSALLRALAFHEAWDHAPTRVEWVCTVEMEERIPEIKVLAEIDTLESERVVVSAWGRYIFPECTEMLERLRASELWAPRKRRVAREVTEWLARSASIRFVAMCNTTALGHARNDGDIDFFIIARAGSLMQTRALAVLPYKLTNRRPLEAHQRDTVCFSYFVSDKGLNLQSHMLEPDDPYFRQWFLSLLPLYDDGVSAELWNANEHITRRYPYARPWIVSPDMRVRTPFMRIPSFSPFERIAGAMQERRFPERIQVLKNQDTRVMITDAVLKFHVEDGRAWYRSRYYALCSRRKVAV